MSKMKPGTRRPDRRLARNRKALMKAATVLFAEKGFDRVTIGEIAEAAQLAKGTFYHYFADKEAIANEVALECRQTISQEVRTAETGIDDPAQRYTLGICVFLHSALNDPDRATIVADMFGQWLDPTSPGNEPLRKHLEDGYSSKRFTAVDLRTAVITTVGIVQAGIRYLLASRDSDAAPVLAGQLCSSQLRALGVPWNQAQAVAARSVAQIFGNTTAPQSD